MSSGFLTVFLSLEFQLLFSPSPPPPLFFISFPVTLPAFLSIKTMKSQNNNDNKEIGICQLGVDSLGSVFHYFLAYYRPNNHSVNQKSDMLIHQNDNNG